MRSGDRPAVLMTSESPISRLYPNGVANSIIRVSHELAARGHDGKIIAPNPVDPSLVPFPLIGQPSLPFAHFPVCAPTKRYLREQMSLSEIRPSVVHVAAPFSSLGSRALKAANAVDLPSVAIYQTDIPSYARDHYWGDIAYNEAVKRLRKIHDRADLTLAPSQESVKQLGAYGVDISKVRLWGRGVDTELYTPARKDTDAVHELRERWSPEGRPIVGYVGRLAPEKQVEDLRHLYRLGAQLVIVGDGPSRDSVKTALPGAVMTGKLSGETLADAYAAFDVFVHTGTKETFGQTLQEAMATGLPVVAPRAGGPIDIVEHGVSGLLYTPKDYTEMADDVREMLDPLRARRYGAAGQEIVHARSWSRITDQLTRYYHEAGATDWV